LIEGEFFGAEKGAYTGATSQRIGYVERANGGVLFLDEIGNMPHSTQVKLLRVLQDGTFRRVGSSESELRADFQLICATNEDPALLMENGRLREDFYDRVAAIAVRTPPLRECRTDIPELAEHFLRQLGLGDKKVLAPHSLEYLRAYDWPGNMRQLQRAIQEAIVRSEDSTEILPEHLPGFLRPRSPEALRTDSPASSYSPLLPEAPAVWPEARLCAELELALAAKRRVQAYKGGQWKAEFMRLMYPRCKAANAKGFDDLIRRLTQGPWGNPDWHNDPALASMIEQLRD
jgi:DNA-binding NtrC family response regulator